MKRDRLQTYRDRMIASCLKIATYVDGADRSSFGAEQIRQDAVIANIMAIGECAAKIMDQFPDFVVGHPEIPWKDMRNMRNRIAHQYFQLDVDTIWIAATHDIPALLNMLEATDISEPPQ